jgi:D-3-phosphoglycerate dehydrogenase
MSCVNPEVLAKPGLRRWQPVSVERGPNSLIVINPDH